jgi:pyruvate/2-oxoglutarate/acetoin dehydrogenase E1 component
MHIPGIKIAVPDMPYDVKGLLRAAIEDENPVLFIEHRNLYSTRGPVIGKAFAVPLGQADAKREGEGVTIGANGAMTICALNAAETLAEHGIDCAVIDWFEGG